MTTVGLPTPLVAAMKLSVPINGLFVPFKRCVDNLQRFCRPVMFHNDDPTFDLSYSGSSFLFRYRGRNLMLCTRHQLGKGAAARDPQDIMLIIEEAGRKVGLGPNEVTRANFAAPEQRDLEDIFLAEYRSVPDGRNLDPHFLRFDLDELPDLRSVPADRIVLTFAIGYPTRFSSFETTFDAEDMPVGLDVVSRWCKLYLEPRAPDAWDRDYRLPLRLHREFHADLGDPDGFSGSPVFFVHQDESKQAHLGFAGMIAEANADGRFSIYEAAYIRQVVDGLLATPPK